MGAVRPQHLDIERLDPLDLDLDTAEELASVAALANAADGVDFPPQSGPALLTLLQLQSEGRPMDGVWAARDGRGRVVGRALMSLPHQDNTASAWVRGAVLPDQRGRGIGRALLAEAAAEAARADRHRIYTSTFEGSPGPAALSALGFAPLGTVDAIRRVDVHGDEGRWQRLHDEAAARAGDYELVRLVGPTPPQLLDDLVVLHAAINDAPLDDPDMEEDAWSRDRVLSYDRAMAGRHQTVYRVLARHRSTGEWAGMSMLCVDEFSPSVAFQEDTSVVRAHRGHALGLLMKADMLLRLVQERPEVAATITWNATTNHHMIAVNERLGATVVARSHNYRLDRGRG
jgi:GNAT superfamily N-acetyltransferase